MERKKYIISAPKKLIIFYHYNLLVKINFNLFRISFLFSEIMSILSIQLTIFSRGLSYFTNFELTLKLFTTNIIQVVLLWSRNNTSQLL